jgi:hypothetical protein
MLSFLFWNLNNKPLQERVARLASTKVVDVLMLAECEVPVAEMLAALNTSGEPPYCLPQSEAQKLKIFTRLPEHDLVAKYDNLTGSLTIRQLRLRGQPSVLLAVVHLPSKMDWDLHDQTGAAAELAWDIRKVEGKRWADRTILVGDLNMNPFDPGVVIAHGLHGMMTKTVARRGSREVQRTAYPFFYNPMWGCFGDRTDGPPGTFYLGTSKPVNYFWNIYDQVLLRPGLMELLREVTILDTDGSESLLTPSGLPHKGTGSDHLPLLFRMDL